MQWNNNMSEIMHLNIRVIEDIISLVELQQDKIM